MLQALWEQRKVWNLKGGGCAPHRSRKPSLTAVFVYVGVQRELGPSASPKHWIPRKVKGVSYGTVKTLSTKQYDVWDRGICFKRTGRCVEGKGKKTIQGKGMASAQILRLSYEPMRHYLSLSMYVCSLETKMLIKWQTKWWDWRRQGKSAGDGICHAVWQPQCDP